MSLSKLSCLVKEWRGPLEKGDWVVRLTDSSPSSCKGEPCQELWIFGKVKEHRSCAPELGWIGFGCENGMKAGSWELVDLKREKRRILARDGIAPRHAWGCLGKLSKCLHAEPPEVPRR